MPDETSTQSTQPNAILDAQFQIIAVQFPELTDAQSEQIRERLRANLKLRAKLHTVQLSNADAPAGDFIPGKPGSAK